jgi:hypothetical protein
MSHQHRTRGTWFRLLAECMFDRSTLERVISPALADLQHECATSAGGASRQWIWCRAYWGVWKTLGVCLMDAMLRDPHGTGRAIRGETLVFLTIIALMIFTPIVVGVIFPLGTQFGIQRALMAAVFLLPQALSASLPAAFFLALALYRDEEQPGVPIVPSLLSGSLACMLAVSVLSGIVVPSANDAYRVLVLESVQAGTRDADRFFLVSPQKGPSEMTWWELNDYVTHAPSTREAARARARRWERFAFVGLVPVLALLGRGLSNRWRSPRVTFAAALTMLIAYYVCFSIGAAGFAKPVVNGPWTVNGIFLIVALGLWRRRSTWREGVA